MPTDWSGLNIANFQGGWTRPEQSGVAAAPAASLPKPQQAPRPMQQQMPMMASYGGQATDWLHPMQRQGLNQYMKGISDTNDAISREMDSRVEQTREWDQRAHEQQLAGMKHQAEMARTQGEIRMRQQELAAKNQRNAALMRAAGLGGRTLVNGRPVDSFAPFRSSLLG